MCSICGYYTLSARPRADFMPIAFEAMRHRGPDAERSTLYRDGAVCLGHQRLAIVDLSRSADQPMETEASAITFNGEVYNYVELRNAEFRGDAFATRSDTEVLLKGLERDGLAFLHKVNGMFAFALLDKASGTLSLVRDRFGVKPLHYLIQDDVLYFASELRPLIAIKRELRPDLDIYRAFLESTATDFDERTFIDGIRQVPKGHALTCRGGTVTLSRWYAGNDFAFDRTAVSTFERAVETVEDLLVDAIDKRMRSDAPICVTLSGGVDSTLLYTLIHERLGRRVTPFVFAHPGAPTDESEKARAIATRYGDDLHVVVARQDQGPEDLLESLRALEFPIWSCAGIAHMTTYKAIAAQGFRVVIEGHGSDEQLGGYGYMLQARLNELARRGQLIDAWRTARVLRAAGNPAQPVHDRRSILEIAVGVARQTFKRPNVRNSFELALDDAFGFRVLPIVLRASDRLAMNSAVESRSPFLDYRLVEVLRALPAAYKVSSLGSKAVLRAILRKYDKTAVSMDQRKTGFGSDVDRFLAVPRNIEFLRRLVRGFNMPAFASHRRAALAALHGPAWKRRFFDWRVASLGFINAYYGFQ
jgi:asparagine synthase (glutamine-hydrolysing)